MLASIHCPSSVRSIWLGGGSDATLKRAAKWAQGWILLSRPDERTALQLESLHGHLRDQGRDPAAFGVEAWIRSNNGGPDVWRATAEQWRALGASHLAFYTSGLGVGGLDQQIDAMRRYLEVMRGLQ
jgi:alkanesulfonate monooxygenase SsuD/methylene tetrahydromethanopterin reductase-like flavin-dependent oxidoreductase (luciferase family)